MEPIKTVVNSRKYTFQITDNTLLYGDQIYSRNFKIGGSTSECVNISISYKNNAPVSAYIPYVAYDPECSINMPLDSGRGTIVMMKTLLNHIHKQIPTVTEVKFEDKSNIQGFTESSGLRKSAIYQEKRRRVSERDSCENECATDVEISTKGSRFRKKGTHIYPIPLYYFSIAFNGETWYEKHFNARQNDSKKHAAYKMRINMLLNIPETKSAITFFKFLEMTSPPSEIVKELSEYYERAETFGKFFQSIPKSDRCRLVRSWIGTFMSNQLSGVFDNSDWVIDIPSFITGGGKRNTKKRYYCPKCKVHRNITYRDFGVGVTDV
jgi:hypothetical protein